jgi:Coenzyme PQQ synthesis protein D (PqqD)
MSKTAIKPVSRKSDLVTQEFEKEILIYDTIIDKAFSLNETSALIWNLCNGSNSVSEIAAGLSKKLNSPVNEDFVWLALEQLKKDNLLKNGEEISINFGGLTRRDVIRKIGFASLIVLPMVSSLIAPPAVNASSSGTCSGTCQCPNSTVNSCSPDVGAATYQFCQTKAPTATCRCRGPFGADGSGTTPNQKLGNCATS